MNSTNRPRRTRGGLRSTDPETVLRALAEPRRLRSLPDLAALVQRSRAHSLRPGEHPDREQWALVAVAVLAVLLGEVRRLLADALDDAVQLGVDPAVVEASRSAGDDASRPTSTTGAGPGDVVLPAVHVVELRRMLGQLDDALDDESVPLQTAHSAAVTLAGYLQATLRSASGAGR